MKKMTIEERRRKFLAELKSIAKAKGMTDQEIADRTGFLSNNVNRMLNGHYPPTLDNLMKLGDAIGPELRWSEK